ncbi:hypothetical protein EZ449_19500 [Pedobacter frigidisoli]|uniref:histidine kinase n=1 Tax=Pedobacter frigidisoli TaxID=2530455 RepID=A0A4R0NSC4_9SPHI|nr:ATP-binding protein [Pedobacter frigidisoli]TCD01984.1 hypothetical protein EZ449_19500 [Pedobacter frigidisoli]
MNKLCLTIFHLVFSEAGHINFFSNLGAINVAVCAIVAISFGAILYINKKNLSTYKDKLNFQNEFIKSERERISGEIHDEIGSGLTALKLYTELASRTRPDVEEMQKIRGMVNEVSEKINEIIWSTNAQSDELEDLLYYIEGQIRKLFELTTISFSSELPELIPNYVINSQSRKECYLLVKEIAHNILKHAAATKVKLTIDIDNDNLLISIKDDGIGFDPDKSEGLGKGLHNIRQRTDRLKGTLIIESYKGTLVNIKIPLKVNLMVRMS